MKSASTISRKHFSVAVIIFMTAFILAAFQNCSKAAFSDLRYVELASSSSIQTYKTNEETLLEVQPDTFTSISGRKSVFTITRQPTHGTITSFNSETGKFTYMPALKFFGNDEFQYIEQESGVKDPHQVPIYIEVVMISRQPTIITDSVGFEMNTTNTELSLTVRDYHDLAPEAVLSLDRTLQQVQTQHGTLRQTGVNRFSYTPNLNFRGLDKFEFTAKNVYGQTSKKWVTLDVGNPFRNLEPSLAVRGIGCASCHLKSTSKLITDFGFGSSFFFGKDALAKVGASPFEPPFSFYSDHGGASFKTATLQEILVPNVPLPFSPAVYLKSPEQVQAAAATTIPGYVKAVSGSAVITTKDQIYIGAPSAATLLSRTNIGLNPTAYFKNQDTSPELSGLIKSGAIYTASELTCDGDLVINGSLQLTNLVLTTNSGCRIYTTGPIFINGKITYVQHTAEATNNTNLQLVSSIWINLGVGLTHCESSVNYPTNVKAWYRDHATAGYNPFGHRMIIYPAQTRAGRQDGAALKVIQQSLVKFQDASCRPSTNGEPPREVHFERLLLNAPRIDSRYTGQFTGVVIAETVLMSLSSFSFSFDPVFSRVPVLPLLLPSDYLIVK